VWAVGRRACDLRGAWCNVLGWVVVYGLMIGAGRGSSKRVVARGGSEVGGGLDVSSVSDRICVRRTWRVG